MATDRERCLEAMAAALDAEYARGVEDEHERIAWLGGTEPMTALRTAIREDDSERAMLIVGGLLLASQAQIAALQERAALAEQALAAAKLGGRAA